MLQVHSAGFVISTIKGNKRQQQTMCFWMHISRWTDLQRDEKNINMPMKMRRGISTKYWMKKQTEVCAHLYSLLLREWSLRAQPRAMTSKRLQTRLPIRAAVITFLGTAARQSLSSLPSKQSSWPSHRHVSKMHRLVPQWKFPGWQS